MAQELFKSIPISELIALVRANLPSSDWQGSRHALENYPHIDIGGRPINPEDLSQDEKDRYAEIAITDSEAERLAVATKEMSVHDLMKIVNEEVTNPAAANHMRKGFASYLLASGTRSTNAYGKIQEQYKQAVKAFKALSQENIKQTAGQKVLDSLEARLSQQTILLADEELIFLKTRTFDRIDPEEFTPYAQKQRARINEKVAHFEKCRMKNFSLPFYPVYEAEGMKSVEAEMQLDTTSSWLLNHFKQSNVPIVFYRYATDDQTILKSDVSLGAYMFKRGFAIVGRNHVFKKMEQQYVVMILNKLEEGRLAVAGAHEMRHFWQEDILTPLEHFLSHGLNGVLELMVVESDAYAVSDKVAWSLWKKGKASPLYGAKEFDEIFKSQPENLSLAVRLKTTLHERFIANLERQCSSQGNLPYALEECMTIGTKWYGDLDMCTRQISSSPFFAPEFLKRITQIGGTASYLTDEGIERIQQIIMKSLSTAISQFKPVKEFRKPSL